MLIAFDLDGTLVDSLRDLADASSVLSQEYGGPPLGSAEVCRMIGDGAPRLVERIFAHAGRPTVPPGALARYLEVSAARMLDHTVVYPNMVDVLTALAPRHVLALLTNKPEVSSLRVLDHLDLGRFFALRVYGDDPLTRKPSPAGLCHLMTRAGADPATTLFVGDSLVDLETARAAGTLVCLARYGFGFGSIPAGTLRGNEWLIDRPAELPRVIAAVVSRHDQARA